MMKKSYALFLFLVMLGSNVIAQNVGINATGAAPDGSAMLDIAASNKGLLIPRVALTSTTDATTIPSPATSLLVYNTATAGTAPDNVTPGYYYWNGTKWVRLLNNTGNNGTAWLTTGNAGTNAGTNFLGTTDNVPLNFRVNNTQAGHIGTTGDSSVFLGLQAGFNDDGTNNQNTFIGTHAGYSNTTGYSNTASGYQALYSNTSGGANTASGSQALYSNTTGNWNTAIGRRALYSNTTGFRNTAIGRQALYSNTTGGANTAVGNVALYSNTSGGGNTASGYQALYSNTTGFENTAIGRQALYSNTSGNWNTACGRQALYSNTTGGGNTANGAWALRSNTIGSANTAIGRQALYFNVAGSNATAIGCRAMYFANDTSTGFINYNVAVGYEALRGSSTPSANTGNYNTALGYQTLLNNTTGSDNTASGSYALYNNTTGSANTAIGRLALRFNTTGSYNTSLGYYAGYGAPVAFNQCTFVGANSYPTQNRTNVTMLGYGITNGQCTGYNQVLLGNTAIAEIRAQVGSITTYSDKRFKTNIAEDVKGLEFITRLRPVSYNENPEILHQIWGTPDSLVKTIDHSQIKNTRFVGLIAQEVEQAMKESGYTQFTGIDIPRNEHEVYSLRYGDFIMPLIKSVQELNEENIKLKAELDKLTTVNEQLTTQNTELKSRIERIEQILGTTAAKNK